VSTILALSILLCLSTGGLALFWRARLSKSQEKHDALAEMSQVQDVILANAGFAIALSKERKIIWANSDFTAMLGWTPDDYQNQSTRLIYPDDEAYERMWAVFVEALKAGGQWDLELPLRRKDGTLVDARVKGRAIDPGNPLGGAVWLVEDVTEKKAKEAEHAATSERLRHSQEIAGLASWEYLPQSDTHLWSDELYQTLGYSPDSIDLNMATMLNLSHPDDLEKVRDGLSSIICGTAGAYSVVHRVYKRDGSELVIHDHGVPERDEHGNVIRIKGVSQDITDLALAERALGERDAYMRGLLATTSAAIASAGTRGEFIYWNKAYEELTGYSGEELERLGNQGTSHPDDMDEATEVYKRLESGETDEYRREKKFLRKDGTTVWADLSASAVRDDDGKLAEVIGVAVDITERKLAEEALQERESILSTVLERSYDGLFTLHALRDDLGKAFDFKFASANQAAIDFLGEDPTGQGFLEAFPDSPETGMFGHYIEAANTGQAVHVEHNFEGLLVGGPWLRIAAVPIGDGITVGFKDFTEEKRAEEALRESDQYHRSLLSHSNVGIFSVDAEGTIVYWNETFEKMLGYDSGNMKGLTAFNISHDDDKVAAAGMFEKLFDGSHDSFRRQQQYLRKDGTGLWVDVSSTSIKDNDGKIVEILNIVADITERRAAEAELQEREALLSSVLERSFSGLVTLKVVRDDKGVIEDFVYTSASGDAVKVFGQDPVDRPFTEIFPTSRESGQFDRYVRVIETGEAVDIEAQYTNILPGDPWLRLVAVPLNEGLAIAFTDVSEQRNASDALKIAYAEMEQRVEERTSELQSELSQRRRTQVELELAKEQAEEANLAKSEFLSRMSHELRTPMNAILGFSQLLQHDKTTDLTGNQPGFVDEIMSAGNHLMLLISQLLDMSKIETGNMNLTLLTVPPAPLIDECVTMTMSLAKEHGVTMENRTADIVMSPILVDPLRFKQVMLNLLSNAVKYNREGGEIEIDCADTGVGFLCFTVRDQGAGVPIEKRHSIFEPFNRAGAEEKLIPGTGIGLAIAKQMVELMGGEIGVADADDRGSKFWFTTPTKSTERDA
jgi:PAS domain S-box-containing protein